MMQNVSCNRDSIFASPVLVHSFCIVYCINDVFLIYLSDKMGDGSSPFEKAQIEGWKSKKGKAPVTLSCIGLELLRCIENTSYTPELLCICIKI